MARRPITRARPYTPASGLVAGTTFTSERQYRNALARARGFVSWAARQRVPRVTLSAADVVRLRPSEQLARHHALEALGLMRRERLTLSRAADRVGTTPAAVVRHAGAALTRTPGGWYRPTPTDRLYRPLVALTVDGELEVDASDSRVASVIGAHWSAIRRYLETGDESPLRPFRRRRISGHRLETDPERITELGRRGELAFEDIYRS